MSAQLLDQPAATDMPARAAGEQLPAIPTKAAAFKRIDRLRAEAGRGIPQSS